MNNLPAHVNLAFANIVKTAENSSMRQKKALAAFADDLVAHLTKKSTNEEKLFVHAFLDLIKVINNL